MAKSTKKTATDKPKRRRAKYGEPTKPIRVPISVVPEIEKFLEKFYLVRMPGETGANNVP